MPTYTSDTSFESWTVTGDLQKAIVDDVITELPEGMFSLDNQQEVILRLRPPLLIESRSGTGYVSMVLKQIIVSFLISLMLLYSILLTFTFTLPSSGRPMYSSNTPFHTQTRTTRTKRTMIRFSLSLSRPSYNKSYGIAIEHSLEYPQKNCQGKLHFFPCKTYCNTWSFGIRFLIEISRGHALICIMSTTVGLMKRFLWSSR